MVSLFVVRAAVLYRRGRGGQAWNFDSYDRFLRWRGR